MNYPLSELTRTLNRYAELAPNEVPDSLDVDFKDVLGAVGATRLKNNISAALRSDTTPPIADILANWFDKLPSREQTSFRQKLKKILSDSQVDPPNLYLTFDDGASLKRYFQYVEAHVPDVHERIALQYASAPKWMLKLDPIVRTEILRSAAADKELATDMVEGPGTPPKVEEVTLVQQPGPTQQPAPQPQPPSTQQSAPTPRYASVELFEEISPAVKGAPFSNKQTFQEMRACIAEVSILLKPRGVPIKGEKRPFREPRQSNDVDVWVTALTAAADFDVSPKVGKITLPPTGDSTTSCLFRLKPLRASKTLEDLLRIKFSFFCKLNLLQTITLRGGARPSISFEDVDSIASCEPSPPELLAPAIQSDANDFDLMEANELHITVDPDGQKFQMTFTFRGDGQDKISVPALINLNPGSLSSELVGARKTLFEVSSSDTLGKCLDGDVSEYEDHLKHLATRGRDLWSLLFDQGEGRAIGELLKSNPLPPGSRIQVSIDPRASFAFAWNLLYDFPLTSPNDYTHMGFWGMRYVIEQRKIVPTAPVLPAPDSEEVEIGAMYWKFAQVPDQQKYLAGLLQRSGRARFATGKPIDDAKTAMQCIKSGSSQVLYFCTHGYTGLPDGETFGVTVKVVLDMLNKLPSATRIELQNQINDLADRQFESDDSWIELTAGRLHLADLYRLSVLNLRPFVILNMCDSAQVTPALSKSFIDAFLTLGARAVVGTECSIRPVFADFIGRRLLSSIFSGIPLGEALRQIRVEAAERKNLLGLAYTLFGFGDAVMLPPLINKANWAE